MLFKCRAVLLLLSGTLPIACSGPTEPEPQGAFTVTNLRFFLELGDSFRFQAAGSGSRNVDWSSSNPAVLTIDQTGLAVARSLGASQINASGSFGWRLHVVRRISALKIDPDSITIVAGDKVLFAPSAVDEQGELVTDGDGGTMNIAPFTWSVADPSIARFDVEGPGLTGLREGRTTVRAHLIEHTGNASLTVQLVEFTELGAGSSFNCALATDSLPYCWGEGTRFLAGPGTYANTPGYVPHRAGPDLPMVVVVAGGRHACGLTPEGLAYCWGSNEFGALGTGNANQPIGPAAVAGGHRFVTLTGGGAHTCGISTDLRTLCWGRRDGVSLEDAPEVCGTGGKVGYLYPCNRAPTPVGDGTLTLASVSAGGTHTCGLDREGHAYCWGRWGLRSEPVPVPIGGAQAFIAVTSGDGYSCGLAGAGQGFCWGGNERGQLGDGSGTRSDVPVAVAGGLAFASISASRTPYAFLESAGHVCGVTPQSIVYCWGDNSSGQSGLPPGSASTGTPMPVATSLRFRWVRPGSFHTCGLSLERLVYCWGLNLTAQLGSPASPNGSISPIPVTGQRTGIP